MKVVVGKPGSSDPDAGQPDLYRDAQPLLERAGRPRAEADCAARAQGRPRYLDDHRYEVAGSFERAAHPNFARSWSIGRPSPTAARPSTSVSFPAEAIPWARSSSASPTTDGIFLHDTPDKQLFEADQRTFSNGCVRLEDARRLGRWLAGGELAATSDAPEQHVISAPPGADLYHLFNGAAGGQPNRFRGDAGRSAVRRQPLG